MEEGGWSLDRIAKHVGYRSEVTFARAFKQRYGVAPRWWKRDASGLGDS
jgi:AraC-like DNA-binding protein